MSAIVFPGQGSQFTSMAMDFNDYFQISKNIFEEIEDYSKINIIKIILENENDILNQTNFTQIAIFSASIVIFKTILKEKGSSKINPQIVLGHSLGEYTALVASEMISLKDATKLIKIRGDLMNSAIKPNISGMAALIGKNSIFIENVIKKNNLNIEIANDNSNMQVVISGLVEDILNSENVFLSEGIRKFIRLPVSAAFHSKYMLEAQNKLNRDIEKVTFFKSKIPIISNYNAIINSNITDAVNALKNQMSNKVRWTDSIKQLEETDVTEIIEIGPGKVLSGLISRITKKFKIISINNVEDLKILK